MSNTKRSRRGKNEVNAGSMADIAFLLLIFFLVTTKIVEEQGILVKLPPYVNEPVPPEKLNDRDVFTIKVNAENQVLAEGKIINVAALKETAKEYISNPTGRADRPQSMQRAVVSLQDDRGTKYETYLTVYNELKAAYDDLRETAARTRYGKSFKHLDKTQERQIRTEIPLVISEAEPSAY